MNKLINLKPRQNYILKSLLVSQINLNELQVDFDISLRTIQREIAIINECIKDFQAHVYLDDNAIFLSITDDKKQLLALALPKVNQAAILHTQQRKIMIMLEILINNEYLKTSYLSNKYDVSLASITKDLDQVEAIINQNGLYLKKRKNYGFKIEGSIWYQRNFFIYLIMQFQSFDDLVPYLSSNSKHNALAFMFGELFTKEIIESTAHDLSKIDQNIFENDFIYVTLFIQLLITRQYPNLDVVLDEKSIVLIKKSSLFKIMDANNKNLSLSFNDLCYFSLYLSGYSKEHQILSINEEVYQYHDLAFQLIKVLDDSLNISLINDQDLIDDVASHLKQSIYMMLVGIKMFNPILDDIIKHYSDLYYLVAQKAIEVFAQYNIFFPKEEIGYLTMHIGASIIKKESIESRIKVAIVCQSGISSSQILKKQISKKFTKLSNINVVSLINHNLIDLSHEYDLVLVTIANDISTFNNVYLISPFLNDNDIKTINHAIQSLDDSFIKKGSIIKPKLILEEQLINDVLKNIIIKECDEKQIENIIALASSVAINKQQVGNEIKLREDMIKREKAGNVIIPQTNCCLLHIRSSEINYPQILVFRNKSSIKQVGLGFVEEKVNTFLVLMARLNEEQTLLNAFSYLSVALLDNNKFINAINNEAEKELIQQMNEIIKKGDSYE